MLTKTTLLLTMAAVTVANAQGSTTYFNSELYAEGKDKDIHCGGLDVSPLSDGTPYGEDGLTIDECKAKCSADPNCNAFDRRYDGACFWKKGASFQTMEFKPVNGGFVSTLAPGSKPQQECYQQLSNAPYLLARRGMTDCPGWTGTELVLDEASCAAASVGFGIEKPLLVFESNYAPKGCFDVMAKPWRPYRQLHFNPHKNPTHWSSGRSPEKAPICKSPLTPSPTPSPTWSPTTPSPTASPTLSPTTTSPTLSPTLGPTQFPTSRPSMSPTASPTYDNAAIDEAKVAYGAVLAKCNCSTSASATIFATKVEATAAKMELEAAFATYKIAVREHMKVLLADKQWQKYDARVELDKFLGDQELFGKCKRGIRGLRKRAEVQVGGQSSVGK